MIHSKQIKLSKIILAIVLLLYRQWRILVAGKEATIMAKTTNLSVRLEPGLKEQAESVLGQLGIPVSNAVNIFFKTGSHAKGDSL